MGSFDCHWPPRGDVIEQHGTLDIFAGGASRLQGRLSPVVDGKIQAFPWAHWRDEFPEAARLSLKLLEWTLDHDRLSENPLMTLEDRGFVGRSWCARRGGDLRPDLRRGLVSGPAAMLSVASRRRR